MEINKEKIKKDFEEKPIIDYILDCFKNDPKESDYKFYLATVNSIKNMDNTLDIKSKRYLNRKLSMYSYFMGKQSGFIIDPYLLFGIEPNIQEQKNADEQIKHRYSEYLHRLQEFYKENGNMFNERANVITSITEKLNFSYAMIKDKEAREKYESLFNKKARERMEGLINSESIKIKIRGKDLMFTKIGNSIIATVGKVNFTESGTLVDRSINVYAIKELADSKPKIVFGNLDLFLLDSLNYSDRYNATKKMAEDIEKIQLSNIALKNAINKHGGYLGEISYEDGKPKILYDEFEQEVVKKVATAVKLKLENINNCVEKRDLKGGGRTKSEEQQAEER